MGEEHGVVKKSPHMRRSNHPVTHKPMDSLRKEISGRLLLEPLR
jgi:hypothetical protein